jgi:hypothetical protein
MEPTSTLPASHDPKPTLVGAILGFVKRIFGLLIKTVLFIVTLSSTVYIIYLANSVAIGAWASHSCSGWNEGGGQSTCTFQWTESHVDTYYGLLTISSFTLGIPLLCIAAIAGALTAYWIRFAKKNYPARKLLGIVFYGIGGLTAISGLVFVIPIAVAIVWLGYSLVTDSFYFLLQKTTRP